MPTGFRLLQVNARLYSSSLVDGHPWDERGKPPAKGFQQRRYPFHKLLDTADASVITLQECDWEDVLRKDLLPYLTKSTGHEWLQAHRGKVGVAWDSHKWMGAELGQWDMPNGTEDPRRFVLTQLTSHSTGGQFYVGSWHAGVHFKGEQAARRGQARFIMARLAELGLGQLGGAAVAIAGDINDAPTYPSAGVRTEFRKGGLLDIRTRLPEDDVDGDTLATHHGYRPTKADGRWLDEIVTSRAIRLRSCENMLTDPTHRFPNATDHNALLLRGEF